MFNRLQMNKIKLYIIFFTFLMIYIIYNIKYIEIFYNYYDDDIDSIDINYEYIHNKKKNIFEKIIDYNNNFFKKENKNYQYLFNKYINNKKNLKYHNDRIDSNKYYCLNTNKS